MKVRFQADADLNEIIVKATLRREPAINFQTAHSARLAGLNDVEVLRRAAEEERVLVTHDRKTMPGYFAEFIQHETSAGIIIVSQKLPLSDVVEELILIWLATDTEEWTNRILSLPL